MQNINYWNYNRENLLVHSYRRMAFKFCAASWMKLVCFLYFVIVRKALAVIWKLRSSMLSSSHRGFNDSRTSFLRKTSFFLSFFNEPDVHVNRMKKHARNVKVIIITATSNLRFPNYPGQERFKNHAFLPPITSLLQRIVLQVKEWKHSN